MAEIRGRERPEEVVVMGGHIDSWDVGQGAMDDAGGVVAAWEAIRLMKELGLRPRRTIRVVGWTNEENGGRGGTAYRDQHARRTRTTMSSPSSPTAGIFTPIGFGFTGSDSARALLREVVRLLERVGADSLLASGGGADIGPIMQRGVPGHEPRHRGRTTSGITTPTPTRWTRSTRATWRGASPCMAVMAYVVADMPDRLPR